jgi:hypothetical protein
MVIDPSPLQNINVETKQAIQQTVKQTQGAMDNYFDLLQQTMSATPWGKTDFGEKLKSFTEQNIAGVHHHVQKLSQARDFQDIITIQTEYMQAQLSLFTNQARQLGEAYMKTAAGAFKPPFGRF